MKIALVHDYLNQLGGAEKVLEAFHTLWPDAPVYVMVYNPDAVRNQFVGWDIRTSWLQRLPGATTHTRFYLPFLPSAVESFDFSEYDIVLSSASAFAKGIITRHTTTHICYCHTPTRYLWSDTHRYMEDFGGRFMRPLLHLVLSYLRTWDTLAAQRVDQFIANSHAVANRIQKYYKYPSQVIYPPVRTNEFVISPEIGDYYVMVTRLLPYKEVDTAVKAFNRVGLPLKIIGVGRDLERLKRIAHPNIEFLGYVDEEKKREYLSRAKAFIHPQEEDFGIAAVESMASGRPVIAYAKGGALETVIPGVSGVLYDEQTWEALASAVIEFNQTTIHTLDPKIIKQHAEQFSFETFCDQIRNVVTKAYENRG